MQEQCASVSASFSFPPSLASLWVLARAGTDENEVPFSQKMPRFFFRLVETENTCCFRFMRMAKQNGGGFFDETMKNDEAMSC